MIKTAVLSVVLVALLLRIPATKDAILGNQKFLGIF